ncbi:Holliday junction branch migration protein RuvA [Hoyosella rhizosphaerae]|uniref:Holliday junction branch migration complex subunit RuvA n=1 Tax=Hoyosella rhizosphaerae TaxID=1755582 RepID=A0A916U521_9ACTN|nr:Holliday junction branch migration protein RuvA [Hoyosella rhizosphaerae]MBN4926418.1 Holliday junction branch migration protein RuvA [Hoyosella rhizosphaerae]GGC59508.1 Holliday junction ATP-dependent DNA helicase RuvA [Hoyosella rhizosphaerae]
MIASIRGPVLSIGLDHAVVEAAGVGYRINATPSTLAQLSRGSESVLLTTMVVREDSMTLFGFPDDDSRELFTLLQTVTGVGPRLAMAVLAVLEPNALRSALSGGDTKALMKVPGVGKRVAERLIVDLRDKVGSPTTVSAATDSPPSVNGTEALAANVVEALVGLGFSSTQAEEATAVAVEGKPHATSSELLRTALTMLGGSR